MLHAAFPDLQASIESIVSEGDTVATQVTMSGTHRGKFFGFEPTGNRVTWPLAVFSRLVMANLQKIGL